MSGTGASDRGNKIKEARKGLFSNELVRRAACGDRKAWEHVVDSYAALIWGATREYELTKTDVFDVAKATWLRLLDHLDLVKDSAHLSSWLTLVARDECRRHNLPVRRVAVAPRRLTAFAISVAGPKHQGLRDEWQSHLCGESGRGLSRRNQIRAARGFLWASARLRLRDAVDLAWRPFDAVLGSRTLSNLFVWGPVIVTLVAIVHRDGRFGLVADDQASLALGTFLYLVIKIGRRWRGVEPREHNPRRAKE